MKKNHLPEKTKNIQEKKIVYDFYEDEELVENLS
jgi:hypothetical protein